MCHSFRRLWKHEADDRRKPEVREVAGKAPSEGAPKDAGQDLNPFLKGALWANDFMSFQNLQKKDDKP
jgi:hypothetical protein